MASQRWCRLASDVTVRTFVGGGGSCAWRSAPGPGTPHGRRSLPPRPHTRTTPHHTPRTLLRRAGTSQQAGHAYMSPYRLCLNVRPLLWVLLSCLLARANHTFRHSNNCSVKPSPLLPQHVPPTCAFLHTWATFASLPSPPFTNIHFMHTHTFTPLVHTHTHTHSNSISRTTAGSREENTGSLHATTYPSAASLLPAACLRAACLPHLRSFSSLPSLSLLLAPCRRRHFCTHPPLCAGWAGLNRRHVCSLCSLTFSPPVLSFWPLLLYLFFLQWFCPSNLSLTWAAISTLTILSLYDNLSTLIIHTTQVTTQL